MSYLCIIAVLIGIECSPTRQRDIRKEIEKIEKHVLDARRSIKVGHIEFSVVHTRNTPPVGRDEWERSIWFTPERIRSDFVIARDGGKGMRYIECYNCEKEGHFLSYRDEKREGKRIALQLYVPSKASRKTYDSLVNPRLIGLIPSDIANLTHYHYRSYIGAADRTDFSLAKSSLDDGVECYLIGFTFVSKSGRVSKCRVWVSPTQGYNVRRFQVKYSHDQLAGEYELTAKVKQYGSIWFPSWTHYIEIEDGKVILEEVVQFQECEFNHPIPAEVFTLKGMKIPEGTPMTGSNELQDTYWDGKAIRKQERTPLQESSSFRIPDPNRAFRSRVIWTAAILGVVAAAALGMVVVAKRRGQSDTV